MNKLNVSWILLLGFCMIGCEDQAKLTTNSDLSFFNLSGKVKSFSCIPVVEIGGIADSSNFAAIAKDASPFEVFYFSIAGKLEKVEINNPTVYSPAGTKYKISRDSNMLTITDKSANAHGIITYSKNGDTLHFTQYFRIADEENEFYWEQYKHDVYLKDDNHYIYNAYLQGQSKNRIEIQENYTVVKNQNGFDSLIYLKHPNKDSSLLYTVKYLAMDEKGNWLTRQFIGINQNSKSYSFYRRIEYYD